jgi:hypothetical protein
MVTPAGGVASPVFLPLQRDSDPRRVGRRADVPACGLTCPDSGLGGSSSAVGPESGLVRTHVRDVDVDPTSDDVALGRLLIRKMDEHLREKSTLDPRSKGRRFSGRRPRRRLGRRLSTAHDRLSGNTSRLRAGAGTRDAIPVLNLRGEGTGILTSAARVLRVLGDPVFEGRARHPDRSSHPDDRQLPEGQHRKHL